MQKQQNAVEKSLLEFSEQVKTILTQRVYGALAEAGVTDRQKSLKVLAIITAAVDEVHRNSSRHFEKNVDELVKAAVEAGKASKSG